MSASSNAFVLYDILNVMPHTKHSLNRFRQHFLVFLASVAFVFLALARYALSPANLITSDPDWHEPPRFSSQNGVLEATLHASSSATQQGTKLVTSFVYNGEYPGQTFELKGGDTFKVKVDSNIVENTNLHFHGSHVSPKGNSDNVFVQIRPGQEFEYEYQLPETHPPGLYWYHPHWHTDTEDQVGDGMLGAIIVRGDIDELPGIKGLPERLLVLTSQFDNNETIRLVNGRLNPNIKIRPGEIQRWRILNGSADDFTNFSLGGQTFYVISHDGNTVSQPIATQSELLAPGDRIEILVRGPKWGKYDVKSLAFNQGFNDYKERSFMTLESTGLPVVGMKVPKELVPFEDLRNVSIDNTRRLVFTVKDGNSDNPQYLLDGKEFDSHRVDQTITLNTTEEWELVNESDEWHPFHIHVNPFQVIEFNGQPIDRYGYDDTFGVPAKGSVKIRTRYKDFDGKFVLHCHILFHEDHGMMQVVRIVDPENPDASLKNSEFDVAHPHHHTGKSASDKGRRVDTNPDQAPGEYIHVHADGTVEIHTRH